MGEAIGQVLVFGVGVGLSPIPIIGIVVMLATPRARSNGPAFVAGWVAGLVVVGTAVLLLAGGADASEGSQPATWVSVLKLAAGVLLLGIAAKQWRNRPRDGVAQLPSWIEATAHFTAARSASLGIALVAINPKNLILIVSAATAIAQTGASGGQQAAALAIFVLIGSIGTAVPVALYFAMGERSGRILDELRDWMGRNNNTIMAVICLVIGAKLIGDAIAAL